MYKQDTREIVDYTKTHRDRNVDLITEAKEIVALARNYQKMHGGMGEFIFSMGERPMPPRTINTRLKEYCDNLNISYRSSHKLRKTYGSYGTADKDVGIATVADNLGHEDLVYTGKCYAYDVDRPEERIEKISTAMKINPVWRRYETEAVMKDGMKFSATSQHKEGEDKTEV